MRYRYVYVAYLHVYIKRRKENNKKKKKEEKKENPFHNSI